jgi:hypothetical protein
MFSSRRFLLVAAAIMLLSVSHAFSPLVVVSSRAVPMESSTQVPSTMVSSNPDPMNTNNNDSHLPSERHHHHYHK